MALPVRLFAELALKSSTRCPRRTRAGRNVKYLDAAPTNAVTEVETPAIVRTQVGTSPAFSIRIIHLR